MTNETKPEEPKKKRNDNDETIDEPVMYGANEKFDEDADPRKGMTDPQLNRDPESGKKTVNPYG